MSDAFTPTTTNDFDLDAWILGAKLPEKSQTVYGRADLVAEFEALDQQLHALNAAEVDEDADERLSGDPAAALARRMESLRQQMQGSALTFRFRALLKDEADAIRKAAPKDSDGDPQGDYVAAHWIAAACISPAGLTPDKAEAIRQRIGEGQYAALWHAAWSVANDQAVSIPFSLAASAALSRQTSSSS